MRPLFLERAKEYIEALPGSDRGAIYRDIEALVSNQLAGVHTKTLRSPVRELISGHHRLIYFKINSALYFASGFRKKSAKTPKREVEHAYRLFVILKKTQKKP